ncbi:hypothetical protein NDU88_006791 [Pleurodeles waltl]|uniref:Ig-like domain-containing protein n=1 Tax=Pleurodeles waltl TaxID=8319 RepID=A0AAV7M143_PLEWA|nr:hypothetical protein NDU88_006791 [Pleurodeles waltl]
MSWALLYLVLSNLYACSIAQFTLTPRVPSVSVAPGGAMTLSCTISGLPSIESTSKHEVVLQTDFERDSNTERSQLTPGIVGNEETPIDCNEDFEIIDSTFVPIVPNVNQQDNVQVKDYVHERVNNDSVDLPKRVSVLPTKYADFVLC